MNVTMTLNIRKAINRTRIQEMSVTVTLNIRKPFNMKKTDKICFRQQNSWFVVDVNRIVIYEILQWAAGHYVGSNRDTVLLLLLLLS